MKDEAPQTCICDLFGDVEQTCSNCDDPFCPDCADPFEPYVQSVADMLANGINAHIKIPAELFEAGGDVYMSFKMAV